MKELQNHQQADGATFRGRDPATVAVHFGNDAEAIAATKTGVVVCDRSHWGLIQLSGQDCLTFLHNQSSNDIKSLQPGQGCETVILTSTARTIDLVTAYATEDAVMLLVSPQRREQLMQWFDRYIFFGDHVQVADLTATTTVFSLLGPQSEALLNQLGLLDLPDTPHRHRLAQLSQIAVRIAKGSGLVTPGYTLLASAEDGAAVWAHLRDAGAIPLGTQGWEQLRIQQGRPRPDAELTEDYNPLEAGLWHAMSLDKGCYIGQEIIARLNTYQGVKQQLWGLQLSGPVETGSRILVGDKKVGTLTSCAPTPTGALGLGYVRTKAGETGLQVSVGDASGELIDVPYLTREQLKT